MSGPSGEECCKCYFASLWCGEDEYSDPYLCHRYPPTEPMAGEREKLPITVTAGSWCGEFKAKEKTP